tara:strand:- start:353 stop:1063 length:711 start_codon:yes stop_codon:yes gene_type:complete
MTAKIKLNAASGGGSVSLEAPSSTTGDANVQFKLPVADGSNGQALTTNASGQLAFATISSNPTTTSGTDNFTVADGDLIIGTSGHGIDFSATSDATGKTSELLDDYEEGTFTPTARGHSTNSSPVIEGTGKYVKIGTLVQIQLFFGNKNGTHLPSGEYFQIHGLPYTFSGEHFIPHGFNYKVAFSSSHQYLFYSPNATTRLDAYANVNDSAYSPWGTNDWDSTQWYHSNSFSYITT